MKSIEAIKNALPNAKFFFPSDSCGITRIRLKSSKHKYLVRLAFAHTPDADVVQVMYRQIFVTMDEMEEVKRIFFEPDEWDDCVVVDHPTNVYGKILCRLVK